jgi:hypothetical protein
MPHDIDFDKLPDYTSVQRLADLVCRQLRELTQEELDRLIATSVFLPSIEGNAGVPRNGADWEWLLSLLQSNPPHSTH